MTDRATTDHPRTSEPRTGLGLLFVEDDDGDAFLVEELLRETDEGFSIIRVRTVAEALDIAPRVPCALVDLGLPDAIGLDALTRLRTAAPDLAVVVLTGLTDRARGLQAVAAGAQDYLVKGEVDGPRLARAVRYAIERCRAEAVARQLVMAARRQEENDRLARGLLPMLRLEGSDVAASTYYRPGEAAVLGGDFFDAVALPDGVVRAVIGDVCGHGPLEAAVGVALRIAWRTMTIAGLGPTEVLASVDAVLRIEREQDVFATLCDVTIDRPAARLEVRRHGHPPPLVGRPAGWEWLELGEPAPPLGLWEHEPAPVEAHDLEPGWRLLMVSDGIYDGRGDVGRLGMDGLLAALDDLGAEGLAGTALLHALADVAAGHPGGNLDDDVALLSLSHRR